MTETTYKNIYTNDNSTWLRRTALLGCLVLLPACSGGAGTGSGHPAPARAPEAAKRKDIVQIQQAEATWVDALKSGNAQVLASIISPTFTFIGPDGQVENREVYLAGYAQMSQMGIQVNSIDLYEVDLRLLGDTAIVTGRVIAQLTMQEQPITENVRFTRVYQRAPDGWLMVSGQGTRLAVSGS